MTTSTATPAKSGGLLKKLALCLGVLVALAGAGVGFFWADINTHLAVSEFRDASPEQREAMTAELAALGESAVPGLSDCLRDGDPELCLAAAEVFRAMVADWGPTDPRTEQFSGDLFAAHDALGEGGRLALLRLMPALRQVGGEGAADSRARIVRSALTDPSVDLRMEGVRLALWPELRSLEAVVPLLKDTSPEIRRAAMLALGPVRPDAPDAERDTVRTDELLRWLHDEDAEVRRICEMSLRSRGLSDQEIRHGRMLTDPQPSARTELILELVRDDQVDLGTWLDRLSRDESAAVRATAVRAIGESDVGMRKRLEQMRRADPDPTVRRMAEFYRDEAGRRRW